jgi:uncharacterized protein
MATRKFSLHDSRGGAALAVRITPRARKNEIAGIQEDGTVRVRLTASATEEKCNPALISFLAEILDVPSESIEIVAGRTGKDKLVSILNLDTVSVHRKILEQLT